MAKENEVVGLMGQFAYDNAVKACQQLVDSDGLSKSQQRKFQVDLAIALLNRRQEGDLQQSELLLDRVMQADPKDLRAKYCRALLHFNAGNTADAKHLFSQVAEADPSDGYAVYYIGQCEFLQGNHQAALDHFLSAQEIDGYLRSAYYGAFQASQRLKDSEQARAYLATFQKLAENPRARLAELKYTRMGPKAELYASNAQSKPKPLPAGPLFAAATPLPMVDPTALPWQGCTDASALPNATIADIDGDGTSDLFIARAFSGTDSSTTNAVLLRTDEGFRLNPDHALANVPDVNTALWGDFDNDGLTDVYLCRKGPDQLWRREAPGQWSDVTQAMSIDGGDFDTVDGACFDADHDGDLDYLLVNADGRHQLLNNNRDGSFREISDELGLSQAATNTRQVLIADLDGDDDADLVFLNRDAPHDVLLNDRFWNYQSAAQLESFANTPCLAATAGDPDVDGQVDLFTLDTEGLSQWSADESGNWTSRKVATFKVTATQGSIALVDLDGDMHPELVCGFDGTWKVFDLEGNEEFAAGDLNQSNVASVTMWQQSQGSAIIGCVPNQAPLVWSPGAGRHEFVQFSLSGKTEKAAEMRSNASGIGVHTVARVDANWTSLAPFRLGSGPGQSLQPSTIGLAGAKQIDFVRMLWPDGVSQTELGLKPGSLINISETQRQAGSCPLVFVWDGERYVFVADVLGAGGIGFNLGRADYYQPRPQENLLLPAGVLRPKEGRLVVKLGEPMEEICYFDAIRLVAYDLPPGWQMTLDERFGAADPMPSGEPMFFDKLYLPSHVANDLGDDVTEQVTQADRVAAPLNRQDRRFIGRADQRSLTLKFEQPLDELDRPVLLFDGWVEYAYSQTAFAAWQAGQEYLEPTIEARGRDGQWHVVASRFGYMAGTPRQSTMPLDKQSLPPGTRELRISTNMQIYWDRLAVFDAEQAPQFKRLPLPLETALVDDVGFSTRQLLEQRYTTYDYYNRPPLADARHPAGFYTELGNSQELVAERDNALAIIGPGEELHLEFTAPAEPPPAGWSRHYVLESDGWCKDADLFTQDAGTVEPLPARVDLQNTATNERRQMLHSKYNRRFKSGY